MNIPHELKEGYAFIFTVLSFLFLFWIMEHRPGKLVVVPWVFRGVIPTLHPVFFEAQRKKGKKITGQKKEPNGAMVDNMVYHLNH